MNERELPAEVPSRVLKSLLKKPGHTRPKSQKNRVVINEKLNEFFAADYIILIKEECCADYEEECDCCCQEPEMIRLGNCKECRADVTRNMGNNVPPVDPRYAIGNDAKKMRNGDVDNHGSGLDCDDTSIPTIRRDQRQQGFGSEESQEEDDEDEEEEEEEEEDDEEEEEEEEDVDEDEEEDEDEDNVDSDENDKCRRANGANCNVANCNAAPLQKIQQQLQRPPQQLETLSPPEGYKDVCDEDTTDGCEQQQHNLVCGECNYYHRQRSAGTTADYEGQLQTRDDDSKSGKEIVLSQDEDNETSDQTQQTISDLHQRYLVETITMTTVTERRIVREISEEEARPLSNEDVDSANANELPEVNQKFSDSKSLVEDSMIRTDDDDNENSLKLQKLKTDDTEVRTTNVPREANDSSELSLTFKLGSVSMNNSLKPNSAVRQLFPDPRFISPPPAPAKAIISSGQSNDDSADSDTTSEAQKFLITTESLRLFDAVKRSKMAGSRSDSSESETSSIKRTIERNALRRSLICKYDTLSSRKKNLRSKDLTLEERIRQLTCVDQDDDNTGNSSASETGITTSTVPTTTGTTTMTIIDSVDKSEFPIRTSPSGEERPGQRESMITGRSDVEETTTTMTMLQHSTANSHNHHHHHHHHHHQHQSTYKRITDLFAQKKMMDGNLPDLGLGDKATKDYVGSSKSTIARINTDTRKQFLSSLAPLSCVASTGVENPEDYYQLSAKQCSGQTHNCAPGNRDSIGYNSDSSYSLEDIEAALRGEERNNKNTGGPPDVTRGTPTGSGPDNPDSNNDELMAFVEQDKTRNERIRRRYNEQETLSREKTSDDKKNDENSGCDDDDDELNDYGFNRRPSVRGIKPQFETSNEIVRQLRSRSSLPSAIIDKTRASFNAVPPWPYYEVTDDSVDKQTGTTFLLAAPPSQIIDDTEERLGDPQNPDSNTINRINTMQKQIDDIYQTIAETSSTTQGNIERGSYLDSTLPRAQSRGAINDSCHRYSLQEGIPNNVHYHERQEVNQATGRMLRIAGGGDGPPGTVYNTLPTKSRRPTSGMANYPCGSMTINKQPRLIADDGAKCYRTMYLVPYNGISDPTYQNIARILPPHPSPANYANHIERYPYPRNGSRPIEQQSIQQQQQQHQLSSQRYYARTMPIPGNLHTQPLHLHLHGHNMEEYRYTSATTIPQHAIAHHQHPPAQLTAYNNVLPTYTVLAPTRNIPNGQSVPSYAYAIHPGNRNSASDVQTQTIAVSSPMANVPITSCPGGVINNYNNGHHGASSSSSNSSALSSPTKNQQRNTCNVAERGVPEGAASAPAHDYSQTNNTSLNIGNSYHSGNVPPPNTQNSVYYAMNV